MKNNKNKQKHLKKWGAKITSNFKDLTKSKEMKEVKKFMDEKGITETLESGTSKLKEFSSVADGHLDQLSGKKIMEVVEQRLEVQTEYNDLLASKLDEALERIKKLERLVLKKNEHKKV